MTHPLLAGALALAAALLTRARRGWPTAAGALALAAILYPAAEALVDFAHVAPLVGQPTTLEPLSRERLARMPVDVLEDNLLVPGLGLAFAGLAGGRRAVRGFVGSLTRRASAWVPELSIGWAAVPVVVGAEAVALAALQGPASVLQTADETALFANATAVHVLLLSLAPAIAEEVYYRDLLQRGLESAWSGPRAAWAAIGLQAVLFGLAHASYTSLAHLLGPLVFGLGMGVLRTTGGLGACVVAHAGVNLFYFSVDPGAGSGALLAAAGALSLGGVVALAALWPAIEGRLRAGVRPLAG